jgi:hypothetical protein
MSRGRRGVKSTFDCYDLITSVKRRLRLSCDPDPRPLQLRWPFRSVTLSGTLKKLLKVILLVAVYY